ncbi:MAG: hypothetical protein HY681_12585 [Chloroflexi bacterium]|nr:hypothetical protein [Chloroflexota bacterium]
MSTYASLKTEHGGPKHTQGYWGAKAEAKRKSRKKRRQEGKNKVVINQDL